MKNSAQKLPTTQRFTDIEDIIDNVVVLSHGQACMVIETKPSNFALLSAEDQQIKLNAYAALLNSLSFPIQIVMINRKIDITNYLSLLDTEARNTKSQILSQRIIMYRNFVSEMIRKNTVLDKKFYVVISFSYLEQGAKGVSSKKDKIEYAKSIRTLLMSKSNSVIAGLGRIGLSSKIMDHDNLVNLYYEIYNEDGHDAANSMMPYVKK
jgi:hypothetical protein